MVESIFQTLLLLAYFNIALISISIANYAISVSLLGRETRLSRWRMERRKRNLDSKIKELQKQGLSIGDLKNETKEAEADIRRIGRKIFFLSWLGAVVLPSTLFVISFACSVLGMNVETIWKDAFQDKACWLIGISILFAGLGFSVLLVVIRVIDSVARHIPLPKLEVTFEDLFSKKTEFKRNEKRIIELYVSNDGEDVADDVLLYAYFPNAFKVGKKNKEYDSHESQSTTYPNCVEVTADLGVIHVDSWSGISIEVTSPDLKKTYEVGLVLVERKTVKSEYKLIIAVVDQ
jgi:hypothetical protein